MIENDQQYEVTKEQVAKFKEALEYHELMVSAIEGQLEDLETDMKYYDDYERGHVMGSDR